MSQSSLLRRLNVLPRRNLRTDVSKHRERWHAALSGAVASFALLAERPSSRSGAAQQIFVRGLQGIYHRLAKQGLHIPHGDVLLFGASCSFIMNAWINAPQVLEKGYRDWITSASRSVERSHDSAHA